MAERNNDPFAKMQTKSRPASSSRPSSSSNTSSRPTDRQSSSSNNSSSRPMDPRASSAPASRSHIKEEVEDDDDYDDLEEMDYGDSLDSYLLYHHGDGSVLNVAELLLLNKQSIDKQTETLEKINKTLIALVNKK